MRLIEEIDDLNRIAKSGIDWEEAYDLIFGRARFIREMINQTGLQFNYYDPDSSYEEDITAYINALNELKERIQRI